MKFTPTQVHCAQEMIYAIENPDNIGPGDFGGRMKALAESLGGIRNLESMHPEGVPIYLLALIVTAGK
jgi:hypothetical protein